MYWKKVFEWNPINDFEIECAGLGWGILLRQVTFFLKVNTNKEKKCLGVDFFLLLPFILTFRRGLAKKGRYVSAWL